MAFDKYKGSIRLIAGLRPDADGHPYPLIETCDILAGDNDLRLDEYLKKLSGNPSRIADILLLASAWDTDTEYESLHSQVVSIDGVTDNTQVDLTPSVTQLVVFYEKDITFVTENVGGVVTVYCIGQKPNNDYTIQVTLTEVE